MLEAVSLPGVHILGYSRGRMFNLRHGVIADWPKVFKKSAHTGVAVEIDGDVSRQDLDFSLATLAWKAGCVFALDSDAHAADQLWMADYAIAHARLAPGSGNTGILVPHSHERQTCGSAHSRRRLVHVCGRRVGANAAAAASECGAEKTRASALDARR